MQVSDSDEECLRRFRSNFSLVASIQGRIGYLLMSIHAANPDIYKLFTNYEPSQILYANMVYGIGVLIYSRPNMRPIGTLTRLIFSILGSLSFNYSSRSVFYYLQDHMEERPKLAAFVGFFVGRFFMVHLLAYLYHIDVRSRDRNIPRNPAFDVMYNA